MKKMAFRLKLEMKNLKVIILAAGKSTRLKSAKTKILHSVLGKEIINIALDELIKAQIEPENIYLVVNEDIFASVRQRVKPEVNFCLQQELTGTATALKACQNELNSFSGNILVLPADAILFRAEDIEEIYRFHISKNNALTILSALFQPPLPPFGRIVRDRKGKVKAIIESIEADRNTAQINELNSGIYVFTSFFLWKYLDDIKNNNSKKEYYLTDIVKIFHSNNLKVETFPAIDPAVAFGINSRSDLEFATSVLQKRLISRLRDEKGVTFILPETIYLEFGVEIGNDSVIYPHCCLLSGTTIGKNCLLGSFSFLKNANIADNTVLKPYTIIGKEEWI